MNCASAATAAAAELLRQSLLRVVLSAPGPSRQLILECSRILRDTHTVLYARRNETRRRELT